MKASEKFIANQDNLEALTLNEEFEQKTNISTTQCSTSVKTKNKAVKRTGKGNQIVMDVYLPKILDAMNADGKTDTDSKFKIIELD